MEQIVPMPRLRENPTILWLPNIVISLVSIIYISFIHLFVHFLGEIRMNWLGQMLNVCNVNILTRPYLVKADGSPDASNERVEE